MQVVKKDMHTKFKCQFFLDCERLIYKIIYNWVKISTYIFLVSQGIFFYSFKLVMKLNELIFQYCLKIKKIKINPSEKIDARTLQNLYLFKFCEIRIPFLILNIFIILNKIFAKTFAFLRLRGRKSRSKITQRTPQMYLFVKEQKYFSYRLGGIFFAFHEG